jgi:hypothetical protein
VVSIKVGPRLTARARPHCLTVVADYHYHPMKHLGDVRCLLNRECNRVTSENLLLSVDITLPTVIRTWS